MRRTCSPILLLLALACGLGVGVGVEGVPPAPAAAPGDGRAAPVGEPGPDAPPRPPAVQAALAAAWAARDPGAPRHTRHLRPDGAPRYSNRLLLEESTYLRQHAHNPVDWWPWGEAAFAEARRLGRPVLLSIGYATCHWCHVMADESFEDPEVAALINRRYVAIKVDREARPDLDAVYLEAVQAVTGRGGWPMTLWLTPEGQPFHAGTYFPARDGDRAGMPGLAGQLSRLAAVYAEQPDQVVAVAADLSGFVQRRLEAEARGALPGPELLDALVEDAAARLDPEHGGARGAPSFPADLPLATLLQLSRRPGGEAALAPVVQTLDGMLAGAIHDRVGGGFHRYTVDAAWRVPHYEKMLVDNARLAVVLVEGWERTGDRSWREAAAHTLDFVDRELGKPDGSFATSLDADSPRVAGGPPEEGGFYTWTAAEVRAALPPAQAAAALARWPLPEDTPRPLVAVPGAPEPTAEVRRGLRAARDARPAPHRDETVVAAHVALAITALVRAGWGDPAWEARAVRAAESLDGLRGPDGRLRRTPAGAPAVLEDHAFLVAAALDLFEATGDPRWLRRALAEDRVIEAHFEDPAGGWWRTADDAPVLLGRQRPLRDGAAPAGTSVQARSLLRLAAWTGEERFRARAVAGLEASAAALVAGDLAEGARALDWLLDRPAEVVIVSPPGGSSPDAFLRVLARAGPRNRVQVVLAEDRVAAVAAVAPVVADKVALGGEATVYLCDRGRCARPVTTPEALAAALDGWEGSAP